METKTEMALVAIGGVLLGACCTLSVLYAFGYICSCLCSLVL